MIASVTAASNYRIAPHTSQVVIGVTADPVSGVTNDRYYEMNIALQYDKMLRIDQESDLFHPYIYNSRSIRICNMARHPICIEKNSELFTAKIHHIRHIADEKYIPPEAFFEELLPTIPDSEDDFKKQINYEGTKMTEKEQEEMTKIILSRKPAFYNEDKQIGHFKGPIQNHITLKRGVYPRPFHRPIPYSKREEVERQVQMLLAQGVIEPAPDATFRSSIVITKKKDNSWRFCVDLRILNEATIPQFQELPRIEDLIAATSQKQFMTCLDLKSGFFQRPLAEEYRRWRAFTTPSGTYQFTRVPMGLHGAPGVFQRSMEYLKRKSGVPILCYFDDILICSNDLDSHIEDIKKVLQTIEELGMKVSLPKCRWCTGEIAYLGHIVSSTGVRPNPAKIDCVQRFPTRQSEESLCFLGIKQLLS